MRRFKSLLLVLPMALMLSTCAAPAYAFSDEDAETSVETPAPSETPAQPLTPEGNMALVDDIEGEAAEDKQFIVVQSRGGHYFYIIIDHASEGENIVHFLNQVDEADLLSLIEQEEQAPPVCSCTAKCAPGAVNTACEVCATIAIIKNINSKQRQRTNADSLGEKCKQEHGKLRQEEVPGSGLSSREGCISSSTTSFQWD